MARAPGYRATDYSSDASHNPRFSEPHSEWQLMIEDARSPQKADLSIRAVARLAKIPDGTLFNWLRAPNGRPNQKSYTAHVNRRLAAALKIDEKALEEAYNNSGPAPLNTADADLDPGPAPQAFAENSTAFTVDGVKRLIQMLATTGRSSFTLSEIEMMASLLGYAAPVKPLDAQPR